METPNSTEGKHGKHSNLDPILVVVTVSMQPAFWYVKMPNLSALEHALFSPPSADPRLMMSS